jgi:hypothetical protein
MRPRDRTWLPVRLMTSPAGSGGDGHGTLAAAKRVRSTHMRCITTASLRAGATLAFFMPCRAANRSAQAVSVEKRTRQHRIGRLEQRRARHGVAHFADPARAVDFAGLVVIRR